MDKQKIRNGSAFLAICEANNIACAPFVFQTAYCLREFGIFQILDNDRFEVGASFDEITKLVQCSSYAVKTLLEAGVAFNLLQQDHDRYRLTKTAWFLLHDSMTKANFDFTHDVCYQGLFRLKESFENGKPEGLKFFSDEKTIYPVISKLPEPARTSWFAFDHYYSDVAYDQSLPFVFSNRPKEIYDIGGNTGRFSLKCCKYDSNVHLTIFDLPQQCTIAMENLKKEGFGDRVNVRPIDMLSNEPISPHCADIWWMSQFLDCFCEDQIVSILRRIREVMKSTSRVLILEPLIGSQPFQVGNMCLASYSLYFTAMANGNSKFYTLRDFEAFIRKAGLILDSVHHGLGVGHSLLICHRD